MLFKKKNSALSNFKSDLKQLKTQEVGSNARFQFEKEDIYPILDEKTAQTDFDRHYIYHTAWASRIINEYQPKLHIDISSALYFSTLLSATVPVQFYDYRPPNLQLPNLSCKKGDLTQLPFESDSIASLSCMHVVEHVGLGRYGDPIDYDGDIKAANELSRVLAKRGNLLFVVPIGGIAKICFNAHRIYTYKSILSMFDLKLVEFALIPAKPENGHLVRNATEEQANKESYGCGCFWFTKE